MEPDVSKNLTSWQPNPTNPGTKDSTVVSVGNAFLVDNSGNFLVDNSGNFLITTPNVTSYIAPTAWTETPAS